MKRIHATIHPRQWEATQALIRTLDVGATLRPAHSFGRSRPQRDGYRGLPYTLDTLSELEVTFVVRDEVLESVVLALAAVTTHSEVLVSSVDRSTTAQSSFSGRQEAFHAAALNPAAQRLMLHRGLGPSR